VVRIGESFVAAVGDCARFGSSVAEDSVIMTYGASPHCVIMVYDAASYNVVRVYDAASYTVVRV